ncbi:MAG: radical SAM protein [Propionibacteriaceae bacterium]|jgi:hypothetical protein|nr:radical SAM protein [Propionibacteriaceae bacterium]
MTGSYVMNGLNGHLLTFSVTDNCPARCAHCLACSGPSETARLLSGEILEAYRQAKELYDIRVVVFTGGEPTTLGDDLFEAIAGISMQGVMTRMVTNACWASDDEGAYQIIRQLREAGLDEINFSLDDFHAAWIPPENVKRAYKAARSAGFSAVVLALAAGPLSRINIDWIHRHIDSDIPVVHQEVAEQVEEPLTERDGTVYEISVHGYSRVGRGRRLRDDLVTSDPLLSKLHYSCREVMNTIVVNPQSEVGACCGLRFHGNPVLELGSLKHNTFAEILREGLKRTLIQALRLLGPKYLLDSARRVNPEIQPRAAYGHICEICEDLTSDPRVLVALSIIENDIIDEIHAREKFVEMQREHDAVVPR